MDKIMLTRSDEGGLIVARARDGMGWCRFSGGVGLRCQGCGKLVRTGYMSRAVPVQASLFDMAVPE